MRDKIRITSSLFVSADVFLLCISHIFTSYESVEPGLQVFSAPLNVSQEIFANSYEEIFVSSIPLFCLKYFICGACGTPWIVNSKKWLILHRGSRAGVTDFYFSKAKKEICQWLFSDLSPWFLRGGWGKNANECFRKFVNFLEKRIVRHILLVNKNPH